LRTGFYNTQTMLLVLMPQLFFWAYLAPPSYNFWVFSRKFSTHTAKSENGWVENILDIDNILRLKYVKTYKIFSSPILGLGYLSWEFSWEYSKVLWRWGQEK
jgi:hypothetical protein